MTTIKDMTPEELRIACAEKCGWRDIYIDILEGAFGIAPYDNGFIGNMKIPDYEHDRNALHELIMAVPEDKHIHFIKAMIENLNLDVVIFNYTLEIISSHKTVPGEIVKLLTADPLAIMRAFLKVMEEE